MLRSLTFSQQLGLNRLDTKNGLQIWAAGRGWLDAGVCTRPGPAGEPESPEPKPKPQQDWGEEPEHSQTTQPTQASEIIVREDVHYQPIPTSVVYQVFKNGQHRTVQTIIINATPMLSGCSTTLRYLTIPTNLFCVIWVKFPFNTGLQLDIVVGYMFST